eukprot:TRINITY_DN2638_c0_g1_i1.p1 TRINITY_DN2638_c0_g1~~TRINITY_DN2638_c0_g1_i1.p1  ORF type:complete len:350 (-),score=60.55 TRINITY_DN2638_c0_g1_i1:258-1307(-)
MSSPSSKAKVGSSNKNKRKLIDDQVESLHTLINEEREQLKQERDQYENEKKAFEQNRLKVQTFHHGKPIVLDIGGRKFSTTLDTLTNQPDSFFSAMFGGYIPLKPSEDGSFFIDRDGTYFNYILNYLRTGEWIIPQNKPYLIKMLLLEAEFYQISELIKELGGDTRSRSTFFNTSILPEDKPEYSDQLNEWAGCESDQKWKLIYKGSKDGFQASVFHSKCDDQCSTYTLIKSGANIFGGYTPLPWATPDLPDGKGKYGNSRTSFLFSLVNPFNLEPSKHLIIDNNNSVYHRKDLVATFGNGDIHLKSHSNIDEINGNTFKSYENETGHEHLFTGKELFKVDELEVYIKL